MKKLKLMKTFLVAAALLMGGSSAWADRVYFNDFTDGSGTTAPEGLTIHGDGTFVDDADARFGKVFQNGGGAQRTHYLQLPNDVLSHSAITKKMTIGFWVNAKNAGESSSYEWAPIFTAYAAAPSNNSNTLPMFACQYRGVLQVNNAGWCDYVDAQNTNGSNTVYHGDNDWLADDDWHYYTAVFDGENAYVYFDGVLKNQWLATKDYNDGTNDITNTTQDGLFTAGSALTYICLGGNQAWSFGDNDAAFMFDDFAVYDDALSAANIQQIIREKYATNEGIPYERGYETAWKEGDINDWLPGATYDVAKVTASIDDGLKMTSVAQSQTDYYFTKTFGTAPANDTEITFKAIWNPTCYGNNNYSYLQFGDIIIKTNRSQWTATLTVNETVTNLSGNSSNALTGNWNIEFIINQKLKTLTYEISYAGDGNIGPDKGTLPISGTADYSKVIAGLVGSHTLWNWDYTQTLSAISVSEAEIATTTADYTINYVSGAETVKSVVRQGVVGEKPELLAADKETFYNSDSSKKYVYVDDNADDVTIIDGGTAVVTVNVNTYDKYDYSVTYSFGGNIDTGSMYEDESKTVYWPKYVKHGEFYYVTTTPYSVTITKDTKTKVVNYAASTVTQFVEANSGNWGTTGVENGQYSGGWAYRSVADNAEKTMITAEKAGVYDVVFAICTSNVNRTQSVSVYKNSVVEANILKESTDITHSVNYINTTGTYTITNVTLAANDKIILKTGESNSGNLILDYVALALKSVPVTTTAAGKGFATLYTPIALDFSGIDGLTAYTATLSGNTVTLTPVEDVPANTGLVLKSETTNANKDYSIPVIASSNTAKGSLEGNASEATAYNAFDGYDLYMLALNGSDEAQFTLVNDGSIAAGKAFLKVQVPTSSDPTRTLSVALDGATGVKAIESVKSADNKAYNLAGQRVAQPTKGLYIINGKKVIVK